MDAAASAPRPRFDGVAYLKLFRLPLVFTAIADSAAGYLIFGYPGDVPVLLILAACSAGLYCFGMAANDLADLERDRAGAPGRVLPSGRISPRGGRIAAGVALGISAGCASAYALVHHSVQILVPWGVALAGILAYDLHWLKVPPVMGLVRAANLSIGVAAAIPIQYHHREFFFTPGQCALLAAPLFAYVTALTYVSTLEEGGRVRPVPLATGTGVMILAVLGAGSMAILWNMAQASSVRELGAAASGYFYGPSAGVAGALAAWLAWRAARARDRKGIMLLVRDGVAGIILVDAALLLSSSTRGPARGFAVAALLLPAAALVAVFKKLA